MSLRAAFTRTLSCTAWPSEETSTPWIPSTPLTFRTAAASRWIALRSAGVSLPSREATTMIWLVLPAPPPSSGAARFAAFVLGALARRNALLSLLTSLPREGNAPLTTIATTSQNATTSQRKRTTPLAGVSKVLSIENLFME